MSYCIAISSFFEDGDTTLMAISSKDCFYVVTHYYFSIEARFLEEHHDIYHLTAGTGSYTHSIRSLVVDNETTSPGHRLALVLPVPFISLERHG